MMKLTAEIDGGRHALEMRREGARVFAEVDGRAYELEARETERGEYLLVLEGRVYECRVEEDKAAGGAVKVEVGGRAYEVALFDPRRLRAAGAGGAQNQGRAVVAASIPGKIVRVLVEEGAAVEAGDGLVVVEAMKMQNELKSPKAGTVAELRARAGATVNAGDVLVIVE
ncbi:MAG TPA: biotin/lipoyl-containing protein [Pyrinomonadaceae bacterium]|jgi:biotin carboxyl carrier protein|nr:biotin/lipoyl-containing protein [Pyrinomonadaceae bacterium]